MFKLEYPLNRHTVREYSLSIIGYEDRQCGRISHRRIDADPGRGEEGEGTTRNEEK